MRRFRSTGSRISGKKALGEGAILVSRLLLFYCRREFVENSIDVEFSIFHSWTKGVREGKKERQRRLFFCFFVFSRFRFFHQTPPPWLRQTQAWPLAASCEAAAAKRRTTRHQQRARLPLLLPTPPIIAAAAARRPSGECRCPLPLFTGPPPSSAPGSTRSWPTLRPTARPRRSTRCALPWTRR